MTLHRQPFVMFIARGRRSPVRPVRSLCPFALCVGRVARVRRPHPTTHRVLVVGCLRARSSRASTTPASDASSAGCWMPTSSPSAVPARSRSALGGWREHDARIRGIECGWLDVCADARAARARRPHPTHRVVVVGCRPAVRRRSPLVRALRWADSASTTPASDASSAGCWMSARSRSSRASTTPASDASSAGCWMPTSSPLAVPARSRSSPGESREHGKTPASAWRIEVSLASAARTPCRTRPRSAVRR